jgi:anti-sigma regulatory factor (Ser/Thr protein kinase)
MTGSVAIAADLASFALVLRVRAEDTDAGVIAAVDASAAQRPTAVVVDLGRGGRRSPGLLHDISSRCAHHAVLLLLAPPLAATMALAGPVTLVSRFRSYPNVDGALASLPHAALPPSHRRTLSLDAVHTAPAEARAVVGDAVRTWGLDDLVFPTELVASELVSNAVVHAATRVDVLVRRSSEHGLKIGVRDRSTSPPQLPTHAPSDVSQRRGRGLFLVSLMAKRWGFLIGSADKVVWAAIER